MQTGLFKNSTHLKGPAMPLQQMRTIQPKLEINTPGDKYEQEADAMADKVMRMVDNGATGHSVSSLIGPSVQRKCAECEDEEKKENPLMRKAESGGYGMQASSSLVSSLSSTKGGGSPLPQGTRTFMESAFSADFSRVRVHTSGEASDMAGGINARAFTHGNDIYFKGGQYAPESSEGKTLLTHELTHVVQQSAGANVIQCNFIDDLEAKAKAKAEEIAKGQLLDLAKKPVTTHGSFTGHAGCHTNFCQPFDSVPGAVADLAWAGPLILAGIATKVNSRVVPLWASYISGGSAVKNLTGDFGNDFTNSPTTESTTNFLVGELTKDVTANHAALMGSASTVTVDFKPRLSVALTSIDDPHDANRMNFNIPKDVAGNIAGDIGKDETSFPIGARPSPFNDSREATISARLDANPHGSITVTPFIRFTVKDTIDLCPGDCGTSDEQVATVPLSRFEATGLSGDVPMIIEFDAPATAAKPFIIPAPVTPPVVPPVVAPVNGKVTASILNIRSTPDTSSPAIGGYPRNTAIVVLCQIPGEIIEGNNVWYQTDKGYVSGKYVSLSGVGPPAAC